MISKLAQKTHLGTTLIGILISIAVFSILAHAIFTLVGTSYRFVNFNRARITARHLAQEKAELIRNLPYDNVGTSGGIPSGSLPQEENVVRNGLNFLVKTSIIYLDDSFDDTAPTDLLPTDYKRIRVEVSWGGLAASRKNPVILVTDIAPKGVETTEGGGTLSIFVFDASGQPVPQADVTIVASSAAPPVDLSLQTGDNGRIILPGAPVCTSCYEITVTKAGFTSDRTYSTAEVANPNKPHLTILEGDLTEVSFAIDKVSTINVASVNDRESNFTPLASVTFQLTGVKNIGTDTGGNPVYKYNESLITNSSGLLTLTDMEWDSYQASVSATGNWNISGTNPLIPLSVPPDTTYNFTLALTPQTNHNLLTAFIDTSQNPIATVSATLSDGVGFEETKLSGNEGDPDFGQVFFANLSSTTYQLNATASGYLDFDGDIPVSGATQEIIILTPE
jgi:hypothetical protein